MIVRDEELNHIATDINYEGNKYGALCLMIGEDEAISELRWATGSKIVHTEEL